MQQANKIKKGNDYTLDSFKCFQLLIALTGPFQI